MSTQAHPKIPAQSDLCILPREQLEALLRSIGDLWDSASNEGCEAPYFVGDQTHLDSLRSIASGLKQAQTLDKALRLVDGDLENRSGPILLVVPSTVSDEGLPALLDKAIEDSGWDAQSDALMDRYTALSHRLAAHGIAVAAGIENVPCQPWDAEPEEAVGDVEMEQCRER